MSSPQRCVAAIIPPVPFDPDKTIAPLDRLDAAVADVAAKLSQGARASADRWRAESAAVRYHLKPPPGSHAVTVVVGGTGTGKSTLVNRLTGQTVTAASYRRTFTTGAVAVVVADRKLPDGWMGVEHLPADPAAPPPRGQAGAVVTVESPSANSIAPLVDTPDLDGDQPANHQQADRAFRWADRLVFVVTPEKYQMTEPVPYFRLARRYGVPTAFVMNKCEDPAVIADFRQQMKDRDWPDAQVFAIPRDDAAYDPPADLNLDSLRTKLSADWKTGRGSAGSSLRITDSVARLTDQVIAPLRESRKAIDRLTAALRAMETPPAGVDVNPITEGLQRRLQQRSVLYLVGPQRVLDRVRQVPTLLARMPRATWDWVMRGSIPGDLVDPQTPTNPADPPDFPAILSDQFTVVRSRIDDVLRADPVASKWITADTATYTTALLPPESAAAIALDEIAQLKQWLEARWNATPRDTKMLNALLKRLPGGTKLTKWSEAAPYLLTIVMVAHHFMFPHIDLLVLGGYGIATWISEKIGNEVSAKTRTTNRKISRRFEQLAHEQIDRVCKWLDRQAVPSTDLDRLEELTAKVADAADSG
jgi:hypothetical protein